MLFFAFMLILVSDMDNSEYLIRLGKQIIKLREAKKMSQADLSRAVDKEAPSINRLEKGKINPSITYLREIAKGLGVSVSELLDFR
jgi:putative transcriptional regulator